jgi:hypothetical protein
VPDPTDMILPMLREMREEMRQGFSRVDRRFDGLDARLRAVEKVYAAREVEERLSKLEQKVEALERRE